MKDEAGSSFALDGSRKKRGERSNKMNVLTQLAAQLENGLIERGANKMKRLTGIAVLACLALFGFAARPVTAMAASSDTVTITVYVSVVNVDVASGTFALGALAAGATQSYTIGDVSNTGSQDIMLRVYASDAIEGAQTATTGNAWTLVAEPSAATEYGLRVAFSSDGAKGNDNWMFDHAADNATNAAKDASDTVFAAPGAGVTGSRLAPGAIRDLHISFSAPGIAGGANSASHTIWLTITAASPA